MGAVVVGILNICDNWVVLGTNPLKTNVVVFPPVPVGGMTTALLPNDTSRVGIEIIRGRGTVVVLVKFKPLLGTGFVSKLASRCCKSCKFCKALGSRVVCAGKIRVRIGKPDAKLEPSVGMVGFWGSAEKLMVALLIFTPEFEFEFEKAPVSMMTFPPPILITISIEPEVTFASRVAF